MSDSENLSANRVRATSRPRRWGGQPGQHGEGFEQRMRRDLGLRRRNPAHIVVFVPGHNGAQHTIVSTAVNGGADRAWTAPPPR